MNKKMKLRWSRYHLIDKTDDLIGDLPVNYPGWLICPECGMTMPFYGSGTKEDYFECDNCLTKIFAEEIADGEYPDIGCAPLCCRECDGPYPDCRTTCRIFDD